MKTEAAESTVSSPAATVGSSLGDRLDAAKRTLPRRKFFSDMPDKGLFAALALIGFAGIMLLKNYDLLNGDIIAALAVFVMILYGVVSFQMPAVQIRPDRLGDNFYYLGFIYTLASLSAALLQLRQTAVIEDLLGNFGIALVTTVVGVAGRVLFAQMRGDIDEVEEHVRRDLVSASADLRGQLILALREFETFHVGVLQATDEIVLKAEQRGESEIGQIGAVAEAVIARIDAAAAASEARAEKRAELIEEQIGQIAIVVQAAIEKINAAAGARDGELEKLAALVEKLMTAIDQLPLLSKIELPTERLQNEFMSFSAVLERLIGELRSAALRTGERRRKPRRKWYWPFGPGTPQ